MKPLCTSCAGAGEAHYPDGTDNLEGFTLRTCEACWGTGTRYAPSLSELKTASLSMKLAIEAMDRQFGKRSTAQ